MGGGRSEAQRRHRGPEYGHFGGNLVKAGPSRDNRPRCYGPPHRPPTGPHAALPPGMSQSSPLPSPCLAWPAPDVPVACRRGKAVPHGGPPSLAGSPPPSRGSLRSSRSTSSAASSAAGPVAAGCLGKAPRKLPAGAAALQRWRATCSFSSCFRSTCTNMCTIVCVSYYLYHILFCEHFFLESPFPFAFAIPVLLATRFMEPRNSIGQGEDANVFFLWFFFAFSMWQKLCFSCFLFAFFILSVKTFRQ